MREGGREAAAEEGMKPQRPQHPPFGWLEEGSEGGGGGMMMEGVGRDVVGGEVTVERVDDGVLRPRTVG